MSKWSIRVIVGCAVLALAGVTAAPHSAHGAGDTKRTNSAKRLGPAVYVRRGNDGAAKVATAEGGRLVADYSEFSLWRVPTVSDTLLAAGAEPVLEGDAIALRGRSIDTAADIEPSVPAKLRSARATGRQLSIVQFVGPVKPEWYASLGAAGLKVVMPLPPNSYIVSGDAAATAGLDDLQANNAAIGWVGPYRPAYRLATSVEKSALNTNASISTEVTVQLVAGSDDDLALVIDAGTVIGAPRSVIGLTNIDVRVPRSAITTLATLPNVVNIEEFVAPELLDESQGQILAGNIVTSAGNKVPSGPGYLAWLTSKGFSTTPSNHPIVAVVDDGVDNGTANPLHADLHQGGTLAGASKISANFDCTGGGNSQGVAGHGHINAGILGGFNNKTGAAFEDASGYNYGIGIDPWARMSNVKIFTDAGGFSLATCPGANDLGIVEKAFAQGAKITSNSWGANVGGAYDSSSQAYDAYTRDASAITAGSQPMLHIFAAGNDGSGAPTIGSPGTAKNVLTVGATEGVRDNGVLDGCGLGDANNADDIATFSSRGTTDSRAKPDMVGPGTHIQGPAGVVPSYNGTGVCGPKYYPAAQTLYTWSSGTSHSTPAVSGMASLAYEYYKRAVNVGSNPSPAMLKALLLNGPRYLNGLASGGTLPGLAQGWGDGDLSKLVDASRWALDQSTVFTAAGQKLNTSFTIANSAKPTRITMAFSDAPGSTVGNSWVNDLDVFVVAGGKLYRGNVFSGQNSVTGGASDSKNNVEQVWLPAGISGPVTVQVLARTIAGSGIPGGAALDQDFALTTVNLTKLATPAAVVPYIASVTASDAGTGANNNGVFEPGEPLRFTTVVGNLGTGSTSAGALAITVPVGSTIAASIDNKETVPTLASGSEASVGGTSARIVAGAACNGAAFTIRVAYTTNSTTATYDLALNTSGPDVIKTSTDVPKAIPDNNPTGVASTLTMAGVGVLTRAPKLTLNINHTFDGDLLATLTSPSGAVSTLTAHRGGSGDNFTNTVFDDAAATAIGAGAAPFTGTFRPETPLSVFTGTNANGVWTLRLNDNAGADTGTLTAWSMKVPLATCAAVPVGVAVKDAPDQNEGTGAGTTNYSFSVVRTGPTTAPLTITVRTSNNTAVAPGDYTARTSVTVTFPIGNASQTVVVAGVRDATVEPKEAFNLQVITPLPAGTATVRSTGSTRILNDD